MSDVLTICGGNLSPATATKPWGRETTVGVGQRVAIKAVSLKPHRALSRQLHVFKEEIYFVLQGSGRLELGADASVVHLLTRGDAVLLPPGTVHRIVGGAHGLVIIEASTPELTDIIRVDDRYGRHVTPHFDTSRYWSALLPG
jgi:mannose-6-phosphate isomerase-like protein (cupin superfamily)